MARQSITLYADSSEELQHIIHDIEDTGVALRVLRFHRPDLLLPVEGFKWQQLLYRIAIYTGFLLVSVSVVLFIVMQSQLDDRELIYLVPVIGLIGGALVALSTAKFYYQGTQSELHKTEEYAMKERYFAEIEFDVTECKKVNAVISRPRIPLAG